MKQLFWLALLPATGLAAPIKGFEQTYQDWDLVCDNTGTCRMAGYQLEEEFDTPISILFTRAAGENAPVTAELSFLAYDYNTEKEIPTGKSTEILLNGQSLGKVQNISEQSSPLSEAQTVALLNGLKKSSDIQIISGQFKGKLSDKGATAAMLRMDEFQQRLNTPSALIRRGSNSQAVLAPEQEPQITAVAIPNRKEYTLKKGTKSFEEVMALLRQANGTDEHSDSYCDALHQDDTWRDDITIYPLTNGKVLAESLCWTAAYQSGNYYAVMDENLTKVEQQLANQYSEAMYDEKNHFLTVLGAFKSRGIGDCWHGQEAVWNGSIFIRTSNWTTGSCKGFAGGAWRLPTFESRVMVKG